MVNVIVSEMKIWHFLLLFCASG